jgi:hypothetical protein
MIRWINKLWHGGISGDQFLGIQSSVQSAKNVNLRANGRQLQLANQVVRSSNAVITDQIMAFVTIQGTGDVIAFGDTGKIYRQAAGTGDFAVAYTDSGNRKILSAYEYNSYLYWCTSSRLHRIAVANIDATWSTDVTEDYKTFTNACATHHPMIEVYNQLYIGDGKNLAELSSLGVFTGTKLAIFGDETIVGLVFSGTYIRLYTRRTTSVPISRCYLWDGVSADYNQFMTINGLAVHAVQQKGNLDYVIAGTKPVLLACSGFDYQVLQKLPGFSGTNTGNFFYNCMTADESLVYFGAMESGVNTMNRGIWSYGAKDKNFPQCLGNEYSTSSGQTTDVVNAVHYSGGKLYMGWTYSSTKGIDIIDPTTYAPTGEITTRVWDGGEAWQKKMLKGVKMSFKALASGEKIELFLRTNLTASWTSVLVADYADVADRTVVYKELPNISSINPFNYIEARIVLTAGTNMATSPIVTDLVLDADQIEIL